MTEVLVGLIVAASTVGGVWLTQRSERMRAEAARVAQEAAERRQDERQLRNEKRERIRAAYTELLVTARLVLQRARYMGWLTEVAGANKQVSEEMERSFAELERSLASLLLESDAHETVAIFEGVRRAFRDFSRTLSRGLEAAREAGEKPYTVLRDALIELERRVPELEEAARRHLSSLEQPI